MSKYIIAALSILVLSGVGCTATHSDIQVTNSGSPNVASGYNTQGHPLAMGQSTTLDKDYPGSSRVRLERGVVSNEEVRQYSLDLAKTKNAKNASITSLRKVPATALGLYDSALSNASYLAHEKFYVVQMEGNFEFTIPKRGGKAETNQYKGYQVIVREKDGWLVSENLTN